MPLPRLLLSWAVVRRRAWQPRRAGDVRIDHCQTPGDPLPFAGLGSRAFWLSYRHRVNVSRPPVCAPPVAGVAGS